MSDLQTNSVIRGRGQITIPDEIRKAVSWANTSSVVSISLDNPEMIVIRPHKSTTSEERLWKMIEVSRRLKGKVPGSLSAFISKDRENH